ncbi:putative lipid II flippase FtsW [Patescibacteria group bacterium]|nr:putative lipid II flippase FtsW [Patescibacteria group bacterium]MBU1721625.1 putative lipid II flippase FtsW [Patescibacteria group bacterium]MBU1901713.1 putative lipid II flippase FtsW [Patescibacteria group bacterium]
MKKLGKPITTHMADLRFLAYIAIVLIFGLIMLTSASAVIGFDQFSDQYFFVKRQILYGVLPGLVLFLFFVKLPYQFLRSVGSLFFWGAVVLSILVLIPGVGSSFGTGAQSWIVLLGFSLQPSELMKLGLIFFLSAQLVAYKDKLHSIKEGIFPLLALAIAPILLVILQPDIGTAFILFGVMFGLLFVAEVRLSYLSALALVAVVAFGILIAVAPYRAARFTVFLHPELDAQGIGYHINQAELAIGSGGVFGRGLGHSRQKFQYLPEVHADSIFAVVAEEMGYIFVIIFLSLLGVITQRGLHIAKGAPDPFARYIVSGIILWFLVQSMMNIGAMVRLLPLTGVPLPFVSHGGTALAIALAGVGIIANISKQTTSV